ncbi:MAG: hypothetical protein HUJ61_03390 [Bacilli bacterium]|nr:hypothetical protein [Bacilli bacterium]
MKFTVKGCINKRVTINKVFSSEAKANKFLNHQLDVYNCEVSQIRHRENTTEFYVNDYTFLSICSNN